MNENDNDQKTIQLDCIGGRKWAAKFSGSITRRDLRYLNRVLALEYARYDRQRRLDKKRKRQDALREVVTVSKEEPIEAETTEITEPVTTEPKRNVYKP